MNFQACKNFWFNSSDKIRFLLVGCFNAGVSYLIYSAFILILGKEFYQASLALAWLISSVVSFTTQRNLVFSAKGNLFKQYAKCCLIWFCSYLLNAFLLHLLIAELNFNVFFSQFAATGFCAVFNYVMFKVFAFKK